MASITDFLPKYPNIDQTKYGVLNPYDEDFYEAIFKKKEFYENKLELIEPFPKERGMLTKYQRTIACYMSSHTPYDGLLVVHSMGLGKTCTTIGTIELIRNETNLFDGALIFAKGEPILHNFMNELVYKCTAGEYIPRGNDALSELKRAHRTRKSTKFYTMNTFVKFVKYIKKLSDKEIIRLYSNKIIVIDEGHNLRIQTETDKDAVETYNQFHRFLHLIENKKVMILSGTPMKDDPSEIASITNLILPLDQQLPTGEDFIEEYMITKNDQLVINPDMVETLKEKLKGRISFLREAESTIEKDFLGVKGYRNLKHFVVEPLKMRPFQEEIYHKAFVNDKDGQKGVYINSREASLCVYPDGSYGKRGFDKYISLSANKAFSKTTSSYSLDKEFKKAIYDTSREKMLEKLQNYSVLYAYTIKNILETKGNCIIFDSLVEGSGCILFSLLLEMFGFSRTNGKDTTRGLRYAIITNATVTHTEIRRISEIYNSKENMRGDIIKVIIGSRTIMEGFSFSNVIYIGILTPHWNYSETAQAYSRGIRLGSHNQLLNEGITPVVKIAQTVVIPPKYENESIDLLMYQTSEDKDISIRSILRVLMENAFDCALNYIRNYANKKDGCRECDYTTCKYKCDGIESMNITEDDIDYSTYQLYYANPKINRIRKRIENIFRENMRMDLSSIINLMSNEFTEEEIKNALFLLEEESEGKDFDYKDFMRIYSRTPVKIISNLVEEMFRTNFIVPLFQIKQYVAKNSETKYTQFEVMSALSTMIEENIRIRNRFGIPCYLREYGNNYFLVNTLASEIDPYIYYYSQNPVIYNKTKFEQLLPELTTLNIPNIIQKICTNPDVFEENIKILPLDVQEMLLETAATAKLQKIQYNKELRSKILNYFQSYVKKIEDVWVSTLLLPKNVLRCKQSDDWYNCDESYIDKLDKLEKENRERMKKENPYGVIGKYNPENDAFCLLDVSREQEMREKLAKKRDTSMTDNRLSYSGKVCKSGGWKIGELLDLVINKLKINPPEEYKFKDLNRARDIATHDVAFTKFDQNFADDKDYLRRCAYWLLTKPQGGNRGIKNICERMQEWFEEEGILEIDNQCGVQGKKKSIAPTVGEKKQPYRVEVVKSSSEILKAYASDIEKMMDETYEEKKYKVVMDKNNWILGFSRKKLVAFGIVDTSNTITKLCISKYYRNKDVTKDICSAMIRTLCSLNPNRPPVFELSNRLRNSNILQEMYMKVGFSVNRTDDKNTYLTMPC